MWSSIADLKENLHKIALDVYDDEDEEREIYGSGNGDHSPFFDRRNSHRFAHSKPVSVSPIANGTDSPINSEIERYRAEIKKLQESEAEIKALSFNYAALLKEKEEQISRLNQENGSLKQNLNATNAALSAARSESSEVSSNGINAPKPFLQGNGDQSPHQLRKSASLVKNRHGGNQMSNGLTSKHDGREKELADLLEEKNRSLEAVQASHEQQIKQLKMELEKERDKLVNVQMRLQEEHKQNESFQEELKLLKSEKDKTFTELSKLRSELNGKMVEIRRLQMELNRQEDESADDTQDNLKRAIATLEKENTHLKMEKNELEAALESSRKSLTGKIDPNASETLKLDSSGSSPRMQEVELSLQQMEKDLKETCHERDKALQELNRLKQHLLEKESEESEKMDEDSKIIEELRESNEYQRAQIARLEKALKLAMAGQEEAKMTNNNELQKSKEIIDDLNKKLANCMRTIDAKNVELLNLQTALGQYYAEIEAKEHLERDLALAREESSRLSGLLKDADQQAELSKKEKEEILAKLLQTERMLAEGKARVNKLEEDNSKLRRALEHSMTRLNRMSMDSDYLVDRRIVIKLLVTYFQRNHSKEVLELMVRMLGFSDEDKQRIGIAQQGTGKGVVRGVLGLPGRLVGGILGGGSADVPASIAPDNQSIADLWVDFLLKETEEREKRAEDSSKSNEDLNGRNPNATGPTTSATDQTTGGSGFSRSSFSPSPTPSVGNLRQYEHSDSEFSTVPLTTSEGSGRLSRLLPKY
ncbi:golgin candidate 4 isoform X1 [Gossypium hirsutum]|uniref:Golgin candidate 4 isoform X1 n=1 Tax=Gossypium hirsutum TaxID=3635 RepID=A0ABM3B6F9_GOSHI|nr:golgin candidate 4 isoform X1 [Gossypium hirsutum]XP_040962624.1 golgin candidate 4 isoform X1 [Gossypium hirsutum]